MNFLESEMKSEYWTNCQVKHKLVIRQINVPIRGIEQRVIYTALTQHVSPAMIGSRGAYCIACLPGMAQSLSHANN